MTIASPFFGREPIAANEHAFAIWDGFPVAPGHALVVSRRVVSDYFELDAPEQVALWELVNVVRQRIVKEFRPDGFNVGLNVGAAAGQTDMHVHVHVIPRTIGDHEEPRGGIRAVVPGKAGY